MKKVMCPYCLNFAKFFPSSAEIYNGKDYGPVYACLFCDALVGCHKGTDKPLGRLANRTLRKLRSKTHGVFDQLWKNNIMSRKTAYAKLSRQLKISQKRCHIALFDEKQCADTIDIVSTWLNNKVETTSTSEASDGY